MKWQRALTPLSVFLAAIATLASASASAMAADLYTIDPNHTYPSFEADHMGLSVWRGKFTRTSGSVTLDRANHTGSADVSIDMSSVDFGQAQLNEHVQSAELFDVDQFPAAHYHGTAIRFVDGQPVAVDGELTLHGVTRPVQLRINKFTCIQHPVLRREVCGADASATFNRADFGITFGVPRFAPEVKLAIQIEAFKN